MDKNKIIEAAAKLVAKGAYDKAIKEYQKVLEADPKDVRILQKMGELYQKKNDNAQAATYFSKVAESYTNDGFFLKAVALYKQVLKLDPSLVDINAKLAELHQHLQLVGEAMLYYQIVANHHDKQGDTKASLNVLQKMVDLDPDNIPSRVKLADLYVREGMNTEALAEFQRAAVHLKRQNRTDDYLRVAERISALDLSDLKLAREVAELYLQRGDQKRALAKLQLCFKADPRDIDTLRLLAVAFQGLGQTSKTISVFKELARAYQDRGQEGEAAQVWMRVAELDPNDPDLRARDQANAPVPEPEAPPMPMRRPASSVQPAPHQGVTQANPAYAPAQATQPSPNPQGDLAKLLTETDVYVKYGLHDKALEHLRKVFALEPENIDAHEKAYAIYVASNNHAQAFEQLLNVLRLHTRSGDAARAQPFLDTILQQQPDHPEVPVFVSTLRPEGGPGFDEPLAPAGAGDDEAILVDSGDDEVIVADEPHEEIISAEVSMSGEEAVSGHLLGDESTGEELEPAPLADAPADEAQLVSDFDAEPPPGAYSTEEEPPTGQNVTFGPGEDEPTQTGVVPRGLATGTRWAAVPMTTEPAAPGPELGDPRRRDLATQVSKRVDPSQQATTAGYRSPLAPTPVATPLYEEPAYEEPVYEEPQYEEPVYEEPAPMEEAVVAPPEEEPASEECDEATFFIEQGLNDEAREILETVLIAYPEHQRAARLLAQLDTPEAPSGSRDAFDIAQELADELGDFGQEAPSAEALSSGNDYQVSVEEVFAEFKKGLEKVVKPEDVDTHYDLGIAYKEMGLSDDAISEFTIARKGCIGKKKEVDCLTMTGMMQVMRGDYAGATDCYLQALASEHATGETEKALRYELGLAYEGAGQAGKALSQFLKVQALDGSYRDVASMVERLAATTVPEDDQPQAKPSSSRGGPTARKVGYV